MLDPTPFSRRFDAKMPAKSPAPAALSSDLASNRSPTNDDGRLGKRIKQFRRNQGLTQKQVAERVGVTGAQLHRYETGTTRVAASRLIAISVVLGVQPATLMSENTAVALPAAQGTEKPEADELVELVELFSSLDDQRRRGAVLSFIRSVASRPQPGGDVET